jgi:glycosyltransferase involved in cell wall biosynthesis
MLDRALVSVIIPTRNRLDLVEVAIHSVLQQDYPNVEAVVVDDASDPPFHPAVPDPRIRVIRNAQPLGTAASRNIGMNAAHGDLIGFLDDDDWYYPDKIEVQARYLREHPEIDLVFSRVAVVNEKGVTSFYVPHGHVHHPEKNFEYFNVIHTNSTLMRRSIFPSIRWDERLTKYTDMQFYLEATRRCRIAFLDQDVAAWYKQSRPDQITGPGRQKNFRNFRIICQIFRETIRRSAVLRGRYYGRLLVSSMRARQWSTAFKCSWLAIGCDTRWLCEL